MGAAAVALEVSETDSWVGLFDMVSIYMNFREIKQ